MTHSHLIPALVAGLIEGIVEWLPVSSKTMITLYFSLMGIKVQSAYNLGLIANVGSFFAAVYYFRHDVWGVLKALGHPFSDEPFARLLRFLFVGTLATGIIGIPLYVSIQSTFSLVGGSIAMIIIGVLLLITAFIARRKEQMMKNAATSTVTGKPVTAVSAIVTGAMQGLAALPGISRSGMTITPLLWMGFSGEESIRLSFMLDVLALLGAGVVPVVIGQGGQTAILQFGLGATLIMLLVAAVVSFLAINAVLKLAAKLRTSVVTFVIAVITLLAPIAALVRL
ncbi:MAG: undecaprenyl-diphosphate phosphatase [Bacilli bacterium]